MNGRSSDSSAPAAEALEDDVALLTHNDEPMQTCTAVYGQVDMNSPTAAVTLAAAGHPPPLIVRADGGIEITPAYATMLGAVDDPMFVTCRFELAPGDAIVMCSDGIHDTKLGGIRLGEERVAELLSGSAQASAQGLVDRLVQAVRDVDRPLRDDVAIMALRRTPAR